MSEELDLALAILDHQLIDSDGNRCGKVDDLAIEGGPGEDAKVAAILSGPAVWRGRTGLLGRLAARLGGDGRTRIPWSEVAEVESHVRLKRRAADYGLARVDDRLQPWIQRIPGGDR